MASNSMPEFGAKRPLSRTTSRVPAYQSSPRQATTARPTTRTSQPAIPDLPKNVAIAKPRSRFSITELKRAIPFISSALAILFLICTIYLLATRNKQITTVPATSVAKVNLGDLESTTLGFYTDKITNKSSDTTYTLSYSVPGNPESPLTISLLEDNSGIDVVVNWDAATDFYKINLARSGLETFTIKTELPVADLAILDTPEHKNDLIILLFADGTIEYVSINDSLQNRAFYSYSRVNDLTNIVKLYQVSTGSGNTILVQKASGELTDLTPILVPESD